MKKNITNKKNAMSIAKRVYAGHNLQQADYSEDVILVDGDRVYMDTRHLPPANTGKAVHVKANGQTSYGFNWTCTCDIQNYGMILSSSARSRACPTSPSTTTRATIRVSR